MDWNDVRHFLALARSGSARAAGAALGVSHSTIVRRVDGLEGRLATRLFDRNRDGYTLTDAGRQVLPRAERIEREVAALERQLVGRDERLAGTVSITCCDSYVSNILLGELIPFFAAHPGIDLACTIDSRLFDLDRREADIAIRAMAPGAAPDPHLIGRKLAPIKLASYVARAHAERLDPELGGPDARWISFDDRALVATWVARSSYPELPLWGAFASLELMHQATRLGFGIATLPSYVGDGDPALRRLARPDVRHFADIWLVSHPDLRDNARCRAVRTALTDAFARHGALFRGERCSDAPARPEITPHPAPVASLG